MRSLTIGVIFLLIILLSACDRYLVTVNDRPVSEPTPLFSDYQVQDPALAKCLKQVIIDKDIRQANQLEALVCTHAGIKSVDGIQTFSGIKTLNLAHNQLTDVEPLLYLGSLDSLSLTGNSGLNCQPLEKMKKQLPLSGKLLLPEHCQNE